MAVACAPAPAPMMMMPPARCWCQCHSPYCWWQPTPRHAHGGIRRLDTDATRRRGGLQARHGRQARGRGLSGTHVPPVSVHYRIGAPRTCPPLITPSPFPGSMLASGSRDVWRPRPRGTAAISHPTSLGLSVVVVLLLRSNTTLVYCLVALCQVASSRTRSTRATTTWGRAGRRHIPYICKLLIRDHGPCV